MALISIWLGVGLAGARPGAGNAGARYYATDTGAESVDDGSAWHTLGGGGSVGHVQATLGSDTAFGSATWLDILTITPTAGTWIFFATVSANPGATQTNDIRIYDGSVAQGSTGASATGSGYPQSLSCSSDPIVCSGSTVIHLQGNSQTGTTVATAKASTLTSSSAKATHLRGLQVA